MDLTKLQKRILTIVIMILSLAFMGMQLSRFANDTSLNNWENGFAGYMKVSRLQAESGKPMALFFYTDWCSSCKALREEILATPQVREYMESLHAVKVNPEAGGAENRLAQDYGVLGYPTFLIVDSITGRVKQITRTGNITPEQFIDQLERARQQLET